MDILRVVKEQLHCTDINCTKCEFGICTDKQSNSGVTAYNFVCSKWTDDMWNDILDKLPPRKWYCASAENLPKVDKSN